MMKIHRIVTGPWRQNGYVIDNGDGCALIVDPGGEEAAFRARINESQLTPCAILNTHAHYDHLGAVCALMAAYNVPFYLHRGDSALLRQANLYRMLFGASEMIRVPPNFNDLALAGDRLELGSFDIELLPTPGHTKGSMCFLIADAIFSGDTLLPVGTGRTDLPGGSASEMENSLARIALLRGNLMMHPGHGKALPLAHAMAKARERSNIA
jgi:hydroxyacylglutathione hydrolase